MVRIVRISVTATPWSPRPMGRIRDLLVNHGGASRDTAAEDNAGEWSGAPLGGECTGAYRHRTSRARPAVTHGDGRGQTPSGQTTSGQTTRRRDLVFPAPGARS